ncbi:LysM-like peptidoglycan-binding domain-containing protein [Aliivibrio fischeri]|uniref:Opacity associated proteins OapA n=1 Tax=Aliivibrio fischeri (strain MJ11) TaxID=388396 RepID=B5FGJ3_ALIFM|nr:LysM-like peptidoglycan-binding domain-containing protein [Aliivibrio fischeri]ACH65097.1 opacity associated proteins OapA [Aliivibrio fischeri MJ11]MUH96806.1 acetylglucosamine transferase [Aliivibrio fischeri]MUI64779.1 acetylglucosamine transferase [Aliivibrio fischeri]USR95805.1 acetylglucosamine transferase [Aliivibrio fischeri ATCC 7744 = JCM 18803 = DSM 507]GGK33522.1 acetylglucosamine transferase [Aliivibrio fischeri]
MNKKKKMNVKRPDFSEQLANLKEKCGPLIEKVAPYWQRLPQFHQKALRILVPVTFVLILLPSGAEEEVESIQPTVIPAPEMQRQSVSLNLEGLSEQEASSNRNQRETTINREEKVPTQTASIEKETMAVEAKWHDYQIQEGDTLYQVFRKNNLPLTELNKVVKIEGADKPLSNIKKGQLFRFKLNQQGDLDIVQIERDGQAIMYFRMSDGSFGRSK